MILEGFQGAALEERNLAQFLHQCRASRSANIVGPAGWYLFLKGLSPTPGRVLRKSFTGLYRRTPKLSGTPTPLFICSNRLSAAMVSTASARRRGSLGETQLYFLIIFIDGLGKGP